MIKASKINAGYDKKQVLFDVSFSLEKGQALSIIGPNGSGKTTLLRVLDRLLSYEGEVIVDGCDIKKMKRKALAKKVGLLSQISELYFNFTVYDTVMMGRFPHLNKALQSFNDEDKAIVENALSAVSITDLRDRETSTLSGGQLQRVFLARAIAQDPEYILLDEPTNHLDIGYQIEFISFLKEWSLKEGKTVIGVLHDINLAMLLSDNMLLLENGRVTIQGSADEIISSGALNKAYNMDISDYMKKSLSRFVKSDEIKSNA